MAKKDEQINYILQLKKEAEDATRERREAADELWNLYQGRQDYSKKKDWQSKVFVPKISTAINQAVSIVQQAIMRPRRLFKIDVIDPKDEEAKNSIKDVDRVLKQALRDSNFASSYAESVKEGFIVGIGIPKVLWDDGLTFVNAATSKTFIDPDYEPSSGNPPKFIIEEKEMDLAELKDMAQRINKDAFRHVYNIAEINKIKEDQTDINKTTEDRIRRGISDHSKTDKRVQVLEFWGSIVDKKTNKVKKNQLVVIANEKYIIRKQDNPFNHQKAPHLPLIPIPYPHRGSWGISLVEPVASMQYGYNNIINLAIDNLNFSVNKMYEYQPSALVNPRSMTRAFPGKMVAKHTSTPAVQEIRTTSLGQDSFAALGLIQAEIQKGTAVTEHLTGAAGGSKTATEVELKTAQAQGIFDTMARSIETNSLAPLIEMSFELLIQFGDIPQELQGRYKFEVGGLSLLLVRREQTQNVGQVLTLALQSQTIAQMTNIAELWEKYLNLLNLEDVFAEQGQGPNPDQKRLVEQDAQEQAKKQVSGMSDEEIMAAAESMGVQ